MFQTYFPHSKESTVTKKHTPEPLNINWFETKDLMFITKPHYTPHLQPTKKEVIAEFEKPKWAILANNKFIPFKTGIVQLTENRRPNSDMCVGYDEDTNTYKTFNPTLMPQTFAKCDGWYPVPKLTEIFFNAVARASGLEWDVKMELPNQVKINVQTHTGFRTDEDFNDWVSTVNKMSVTGYGIFKGQWVFFKNDTVFDTKTNKELHGNISVNDLTLFIPETKSYRHQNQFVFEKSNTSNFGNGCMQINLPTNLDDENLGINLFDALGIKYDVFDKVEYDKEGHIEDYSFAKGDHHFAVVKSRVHYIDEDKINKILASYTKTEDFKKPDKGFRVFDKARLSTYFKDEETPLFKNLFYLAINQSTDKLNDKLLNKLVSFWKVSSLLRDIRRFKGENETPTDASIFDLDFGEGIKLAKDKDVTLLKSLIKTKEVCIPIFTPRFGDKVNAVLSNINKTEPLHSSSSLVYLLNGHWNESTDTVLETFTTF